MICFPHHFFYFRIFANDSIIAFFSMRYHTLTAVLAAILQIPVVAATISAQHIEWAIAKEAIKRFWVRCLMTGEVFALSVAVEGIVGMLPRRPGHACLRDADCGARRCLLLLAKKLPAENKENMPCRNLPFRSRAARNDHKASCTGKGFPASIVHEEKFFRFLSCHSFCSIGKKYCRVFSQACFRAWLCHPHTTL